MGQLDRKKWLESLNVGDIFLWTENAWWVMTNQGPAGCNMILTAFEFTKWLKEQNLSIVPTEWSDDNRLWINLIWG